eukprot:COSAG06_NODE_71_length_25945_cov_9.124468_15_plen_41_part_00
MPIAVDSSAIVPEKHACLSLSLSRAFPAFPYVCPEPVLVK